MTLMQYFVAGVMRTKVSNYMKKLYLDSSVPQTLQDEIILARMQQEGWEIHFIQKGTNAKHTR